MIYGKNNKPGEKTVNLEFTGKCYVHLGTMAAKNRRF
jgi:hypothetical protein